MIYANNNGFPCYHCHHSIDTHSIPLIKSDEATEKLARDLQG